MVTPQRRCKLARIRPVTNIKRLIVQVTVSVTIFASQCIAPMRLDWLHSVMDHTYGRHPCNACHSSSPALEYFSSSIIRKRANATKEEPRQQYRTPQNHHTSIQLATIMAPGHPFDPKKTEWKERRTDTILDYQKHRKIYLIVHVCGIHCLFIKIK